MSANLQRCFAAARNRASAVAGASIIFCILGERRFGVEYAAVGFQIGRALQLGPSLVARRYAWALADSEGFLDIVLNGSDTVLQDSTCSCDIATSTSRLR